MSRRYAEVRFGGPKSVFEFDSDFAIYYRWFRQFFPSRERFFISSSATPR